MNLKKSLLTFIPMATLAFSLTTVACQTESDDGLDPLLLLALAGGGGGSTAGTFNAGTLTDLSAVTGETYTLSVTKTGLSGAKTVSIYFSTNTTISTADTLAGTATLTAGSGTQDVTITVPTGLASGTTPAAYYIGVSEVGVFTARSLNQVMVFPTGSVVTAYSMNSAPLTSQTLDATTTQRYYETDFSSGVSVVAAAYQVAGGLDVIGNVYNVSGGLTALNANGANDRERLAINVSATQKSWIQIRRNGSTTGTFTFFANNSSITSGSLAVGGGSCAGGTGLFINNRCADYEAGFTGAPTNSPNCVTLQGTGSVYSAGTCTATNRIARCHANPLSNSGRIVVTFYNSESTVTAAGICGSDILTIP